MRIRTRHGVGLTPLLFVGTFWACTPGDGGSPPDTLPPGTPLEIERIAALSVGVLSGDTLQELDQVVTPFLLRDGRLVIPVAGASSIRIFDTDGRFGASLGRSGEGPGEFRSLSAAWSRGDTLEAFDNRLRRVTRFLPDGETEVVRFQTPLPDLSAVVGPVHDGWLVGGVAVGGNNGRDQMAMHHVAFDGSDLGETARVPGMARYATEEFGGPGPLSPRSILAVSGGYGYVAESLTPTIQVVEPTGRVVQEITWSPPSSIPPRDALREVADSAAARSALDQTATIGMELLEVAPTPDRLSVFWQLVVDEVGFIWVRPYEPAIHAAVLGGLRRGGVGGGGEWTIISPDGTEVGSVNVPHDLEPVQITVDAVVGIARDEVGLESVRVHALRRSG